MSDRLRELNALHRQRHLSKEEWTEVATLLAASGQAEQSAQAILRAQRATSRTPSPPPPPPQLFTSMTCAGCRRQVLLGKPSPAGAEAICPSCGTTNTLLGTHASKPVTTPPSTPPTSSTAGSAWPLLLLVFAAVFVPFMNWHTDKTYGSSSPSVSAPPSASTPTRDIAAEEWAAKLSTQMHELGGNVECRVKGPVGSTQYFELVVHERIDDYTAKSLMKAAAVHYFSDHPTTNVVAFRVFDANIGERVAYDVYHRNGT